MDSHAIPISDIFSDELLDIIVNEPKLCKYVDIPFATC